MTDQQSPMGWYADPSGDASKIRFWDGNAWTDQVMDANAFTGAPIQTMGIPQGIPPYQTQYVQAYPVADNKSKFAIASLVLGLVNLLGWCLPLIGYPVGIVGLVLGIKGLKSSKRPLAIAGVVLCIVTLLVTLGNSAAGILLYTSAWT